MCSPPEVQMLRALTADGRLLFSTRDRAAVRLRLSVGRAGAVPGRARAERAADRRCCSALTLAGDAAISLWITSVADRIGRRRMLMLGAGLMVLAGLVFALTRNPLLLTLAAIIGTISPSGAEVGPFLAIEQAALPQTAPDRSSAPHVFAWYNLAGSLATAARRAAAAALLATAAPARGMRAARQLPRRRRLCGLLGVVLAAAVSPALARRRGRAARRPCAGAGRARWLGLAPLARRRAASSRRCSRSTPSPAGWWCRA